MYHNKDIKKTMAEYGMTQDDLAKELGVSNASISRWLSNNELPIKKRLKVMSMIMKSGAQHTVLNTTVRQYMAYFNVKQVELAREMHVSKSTISDKLNKMELSKKDQAEMIKAVKNIADKKGELL